jgi:hypothetical protein
MMKFITILIGCSLALTAGVRAEQQDPKKKQKSKPVQKQPAVTNTHVQGAHPQHAVTNTHVQGVHPQHTPNINNAKVHNTNVHTQQLHLLPPGQTNKLPAVQTNKMPAVQSNKLPPVQTNKVPAVQANTHPVQTFHPQHVDFHAKPNAAIATATYNRDYRIRGAENWRGAHYEVFRSYHPQWHDHGWWHSHHNHIILIGGGWYFWNAGYWFPAWGYDARAAYYPYDGPIYVGSTPRPFDQVVADVQSVLQEQGYYHGEVDGLVGPLTQEALAEYQGAQGLEPTSAIDQPTLESLGVG